MKNKILISFTCLQLFVYNAFAQIKEDKDKEDITIEVIQSKCKDLPLQQRLRVSVTKFDISTTGAPTTLGDNMATMLENALQNSNCFRILESKKDLSEVMEDQNDINRPKPNLIITGEITEFSKQAKGTHVSVVKTDKDITKLGFVIKVLDPVTSDMYFSKAFNVEGKASGGFKLGVKVPYLGDMNLADASNNDPATADALEKGILEAVAYLAEHKDEVPLPDESTSAIFKSVITIQNLTYTQATEIETVLKAIEGVKQVSGGNFGAGSMEYIVMFAGNTNDLVKLLASKNVKLEVTSMNSDKGLASLTLKE